MVDAPRRQVYVRCDDGIDAIDAVTGQRTTVVPAPATDDGPLALDNRDGIALAGSGPLAGVATVTLVGRRHA